jgi:hypothetical protein
MREAQGRYAEETELRRLAQFKFAAPADLGTIGASLVEFFKGSVQKRQAKLGKLGAAMALMVPEPLLGHCCVESFNRGTLTILCDSSSHLYDLKSLLLAGLEKQLLAACKSAGLSRVVVKPGRWYEGEGPADQRPQFGP